MPLLIRVALGGHSLGGWGSYPCRDSVYMFYCPRRLGWFLCCFLRVCRFLFLLFILHTVLSNTSNIYPNTTTSDQSGSGSNGDGWVFSTFPRSPELETHYQWPSRLGLLNTPTASLQTGKTPHNECSASDIKQSDGVPSVMLELWGMRSTPSFLSPETIRLVELDRVLSMDQMERFFI